MKNRISGLLMETGVSYNKQRLHKVRYFRELLSTNEEANESIRPLLRLSHRRVYVFLVAARDLEENAFTPFVRRSSLAGMVFDSPSLRRHETVEIAVLVLLRCIGVFMKAPSPTRADPFQVPPPPCPSH